MSNGVLNIESPIVLQASQSGIAIGPRGFQGIQGLAMQGVQGVQGIQGLMLSLNSVNYISVDVGVNAKENGAALIAAYTAAKALTPNGAALATDNRACVIIPPGNYDLDHGTENACVPLVLDTEFVDIIGLTTDRGLQHIYGTPAVTNSGVIVQTADDVHISNLYVKILTEVEFANGDNADSAAYFPSTSLSNTVVDNCQFDGQDGNNDEGPRLFSMRRNIEYSGTFTDCTGGSNAFGGYGTASGTFTNCIGGSGAFGGDGTASGTFNNCTGGNFAFGGGGTASGTFNNCTGGVFVFGGGGTSSGTFTDCTGGDSAFGGYGTASGTFTNCIGGSGAFGGDGTVSGTFTFCKLPQTSSFETLKCSVATVEIASGGTNYEVNDELTVTGGTGTAATLKVTSVDGGVITDIQVKTVGAYTAKPSNPVATTGHTGDATFNLTWNEGHIYGCVEGGFGFITVMNWDD